MANPLLLSLLIFAFVVFRIGNRAYQAYSRGYKTWPILALLAAIYVVFGIMRRFSGMDPMVFLVGSLICIIASQAIFRSSVKLGG